MVAVYNHSTVVTDDEVKVMIEAWNTQCYRDFAPVWQRTPLHYTFGGSAFIHHYVVDEDSSVSGALAYHDYVKGHPVEVTLAKTIRDAGGGVLTGDLSVSSAGSHENLETNADSATNDGRVDWNTGWEYAQEVADPVESSSYTIDVPAGGSVNEPVSVSNFVLPHWFVPDSPGPTYDFLGHVTSPFTLEAGGYAIRWQDGQETQVTGAKPRPGRGWRSLDILKQHGIVL